MNTLDSLFKRANELPSLNGNMLPVPHLKISGFFPGGRGAYDNSENLMDKEIMVLGNDYGTLKYFEGLPSNGEKKDKSATWKRLISLFDDAGVQKEKCFFTNAFMGLRASGKMVGKRFGGDNSDYLKDCAKFFRTQLEFLPNLKVVIVLGLEAPKLLAELDGCFLNWKKPFKEIDGNGMQILKPVKLKGKQSELSFAIIVHPSYAHLNQKQREFEGATGRVAEIAILKKITSVTP